MGDESDAASRIAVQLDRPAAARWFRAPGRVNLIGDHTDYNGGYVLPLAIDRACIVAVSSPSEAVSLRSLDTRDAIELRADGSADLGRVSPPWGRYVAGVLRELADLGRPPVGIDATIASDVPLGAGLSSSAALEVACATALAAAAEWPIGPVALAEACRAAEERATGVPCGIMDQLISVDGRAGAALLIDCATLERRTVPIARELAVVAVHSGVSRALTDSPYAERRRACETLARRLGLASLSDASAADVVDEPLGRHVVSENARVLEAARALEHGDHGALGRLLLESHASLRDDFAVSTPELDLLVEELVEAGALGARLTGGGFGGCVVTVCEASAGSGIAAAAARRYRERTGLEPTVFPCRAVVGAGPMEAPPRST